MSISTVVTRGFGSFGSVHSVVLGGYESDSNHDLVALPVAAGAPAVGAANLDQHHVLVAVGVTAGAPVVGAPIIAQPAGVAQSIATGAPTVGTPTVSSTLFLQAGAVLLGTPALGVPALAPRPAPHRSILPPNATGFERSLEYPQRNLMELPVPIRDLWRWDKCPVELLPWLAWAMSVDLWDHDWPEPKKRAVIRDSFELHRRKGTLWCIERYLHIAGAPLRRTIVPPAKHFPGRSMTDAERQAWLDRFPQIRIFRFRDRGTWTYGGFASGGAYKIRKTFLADQAGKATFFPHQTDAPARFGRRAFLWDKGTHFLASGEESPLRWIERTQVEAKGTVVIYEQVLIPGTQVTSLFLGAFAKGNRNRKDGRCFPTTSSAPARIVSVRREQPYSTVQDHLRKFAVRPSLEPILAVPEHVAESGTSQLGINMFGGVPGRWLNPKTGMRHRVQGFMKGFLPPTTAHLRLYDRLYLHDPRRQPDARPRAQYLGHFRLGWPAFTAEMAIEVRGRRTVYEAGRFVYGYLTKGNREPLELARKAVQRSKAHRDKILLRTRLHKPPTTSSALTTGSGVSTGHMIFTL